MTDMHTEPPAMQESELLEVADELTVIASIIAPSGLSHGARVTLETDAAPPEVVSAMFAAARGAAAAHSPGLAAAFADRLDGRPAPHRAASEPGGMFPARGLHLDDIDAYAATMAQHGRSVDDITIGVAHADRTYRIPYLAARALLIATGQQNTH
jgi:hypothetical protein